MRCDTASAIAAGVSCQAFYQRQAQVVQQVNAFRGELRRLGAMLRSPVGAAAVIGATAGGASARRTAAAPGRATADRLNRYMGEGTGTDHNKVALVHNVLLNAERQLRSMAAPVAFDRRLDADGNADIGRIILGPAYSNTTLLHEAVHFGTHPVRREGNVPYIRDGGNISYIGYGRLEAAVERARRGWRATSISAASYSWVVTGP